RTRHEIESQHQPQRGRFRYTRTQPGTDPKTSLQLPQRTGMAGQVFRDPAYYETRPRRTLATRPGQSAWSSLLSAVCAPGYVPLTVAASILPQYRQSDSATLSLS